MFIDTSLVSSTLVVLFCRKALGFVASNILTMF